MKIETLVRMANEIARNLASLADNQAASGTATAEHLKSFWTPAMCRAIVAHLDAGGDGLDPAAQAGVEALRGRLISPPPQAAAS
jgi:formate dehydrogenase subunit delta